MALKVLSVFSRLDAIKKMAPFALAADERFDARICVTSTGYREMLE